jgi:hypothetical protein
MTESFQKRRPDLAATSLLVDHDGPSHPEIDPPGLFAAADGTPGAPGTYAQPWDLTTALAGASGVVQPGDTVWLRGGIYPGNWSCALNGSEGAWITFRAYPGERPILQGTDPCEEEVIRLDATGSWLCLWGLEFTATHVTRVTQTTGPHPGGGISRNSGVSARAPDCRIINCTFYDCGASGIGNWASAKNLEVYGCLFFNNGWWAPDRGHGHGLYIQNRYDDGTVLSTKVVKHCISWGNFATGMKLYAEDTYPEGCEFDGVIAYMNGYPAYAYTGNLGDVDANLLLGGISNPVRRAVIRDGCFYHPDRGFHVHTVRFGFQANNEDLLLEDTWIMGGDYPCQLQRWATVTSQRNRIYCYPPPSPGSKAYLCAIVPIVRSPTIKVQVPITGHTLSQNEYWGTGINVVHGVQKPFHTGTRYYKLDDTNWDYRWAFWQDKVGLDLDSTFTETRPTGVWRRVFPNAYEPGRGHLAVANWDGAASVGVDLSSLGLADGEPFAIQNAQDLWGAPVVTGTWNASQPVVRLPLAAGSVQQPQGFEAWPTPSSLPEFGAFLVLPQSPP